MGGIFKPTFLEACVFMTHFDIDRLGAQPPGDVQTFDSAAVKDNIAHCPSHLFSFQNFWRSSQIFESR
jgi:hypothetical protein